MNQLPIATRAMILKCLTDGVSVRATCRLTGVAKGTVLKLLAEAGEFAEFYSDHVLRNLSVSQVQADEQWSFVGAKEKNASQPGHGDAWTFCAMDADTKLVFSWLVGSRSSANTDAFVQDIASRVAGRVQLTTDGWPAYLDAVRKAFTFGTCDFAQILKSYGKPDGASNERRYSPMVCTGVEKIRRIGRPDMDLVSTSYIERVNLQTRMNCRRFTRLTNGFSKKLENHAHAVALQFFVYNFCRAHGTLTKAAQGVKTTPAMAAGVADEVWTLDDLLAKMDATVPVG